jgi:hypothetical protein
MARELTISEINFACAAAVVVAEDLPSHMHDVYSLLLRGGFRYIEVFELDRWSLVSPGNWEIQTAKGGAIRDYLETNIPTFYLSCLESSMLTFDYCRYSTFNRTLRRTFIDYPIMVDDKNCTSHIFRHNRVKQLYSQGQTIQQISDYLGEIDNRNTEGYINSRLFVE